MYKKQTFAIQFPECLRVHAAFRAGLLHPEGADRIISQPCIQQFVEIILAEPDDVLRYKEVPIRADQAAGQAPCFGHWQPHGCVAGCLEMYELVQRFRNILFSYQSSIPGGDSGRLTQCGIRNARKKAFATAWNDRNQLYKHTIEPPSMSWKITFFFIFQAQAVPLRGCHQTESANKTQLFLFLCRRAADLLQSPESEVINCRSSN